MRIDKNVLLKDRTKPVEAKVILSTMHSWLAVTPGRSCRRSTEMTIDRNLKLTRTALRTVVIHGERSIVSLPDDEEVIWSGGLQWRYDDGRALL